MKQKINWYQEVLEIEPSSRIFFPLAKMLVQDGQTDRAITTLRQGAARHPDHIEARLMLIDLLFAHGPREALWGEVDKVGTLFAEYPNFWQAWGQRLRESESSKDTGLALIFLAAAMRHERISWADIIEHGLRGLFTEKPLGSSARTGAAPVTGATSVNGTATDTIQPPVASAQVNSPLPVAAPVGPAPMPAAVRQDIEPEENAEAQTAGDEDEQEEHFSLRTRSMADVLAEQGDINSALDIYKELLTQAPSDQEKTALLARIDELTLSQTASSAEGAASVAEKAAEPDSKSRLTDMLEALAQRLESRSLQ